jgi:multisubunit Na+/H+ antiporter MnhG subunit
MPGWSIPIAILCAIVFTIIINSYWPMLISMFRYLRKILSETMSIAKGVEKIQENQEQGVELINILSSKHPTNTKPSVSNDQNILLPKKSDNPYCLWCWMVICIFCGFVAALFIAAVFLSLIISLMEPVMNHNVKRSNANYLMENLLGVMYQLRLPFMPKMKVVQHW